MNTARKGSRAEHRCMRILTAAGYLCTRAAASLGMFDVVAIGATDIRLVQVKSGTARLSGLEREQITGLVVPGCVSKEYWRYPPGNRAPVIERL